MWVSHILRREAERLILPNLTEFLEGDYQPQNDDERAALLGACKFSNRPLALAGLYADAFAHTPHLAEDIRFNHRFHATCAAALVGCGRSEDATRVEEPEQEQWRLLARGWLQADLNSWGEALDRNPAETRESVQQRLTLWQSESDLAGLHNLAELDKLSAGERKDCLALWADVAGVLSRCENGK